MGKVYAVRCGRKTGILNSWTECEASVKGYSGAVYKSFVNEEDALKFLGKNDALKFLGKNDAISTVEEPHQCEMEAYVDGSYDDTLKRYSYGVIVFHNGEKQTYAKSENCLELVNLRNVAGELKAALFAMTYAARNNVKTLELFYDYSGIEAWATGAWRTNTQFTAKYAQMAQQTMKKVAITFTKIESHTGNRYNEEVDQLAKQALLQEEGISACEKMNLF